jgi:hypothetical protein
LKVAVRETTRAADETGPAGERQNSRYSIYLEQDLYRPARGASWRLAVALIAQDQATEEFSRYSMLNAGVSVAF